MPAPKWVAVNEVGNDNFATSIYENEYKGCLEMIDGRFAARAARHRHNTSVAFGESPT